MRGWKRIATPLLWLRRKRGGSDPSEGLATGGALFVTARLFESRSPAVLCHIWSGRVLPCRSDKGLVGHPRVGI